MSRLAFFSVVWFSSLALAQDGSTDEEARLLFQAGHVAFENGEYERALDAFERSYALSHRPELLYNVGVTAERLRHDARALEAFRQYVRELPRGQHRRQVEARIRILEASLAPSATVPSSTNAVSAAQPPPTGSAEVATPAAEDARSLAPAPTAAATTPAAPSSASATDPSRRRRAIGLFVGMGVMAAATGGGAAYWANRSSALSQCRDALQSSMSTCTNGSALATQRNVALGLTVTAAVGVPSLLAGALVARRRARKPSGSAAACAPGFTGFACVGSF